MSARTRGTSEGGSLDGWHRRHLAHGLAILPCSFAATTLFPRIPKISRILASVFTLMAGSLAVIGALIVTRQPRNAVGWILARCVGTPTSTSRTAYATMGGSPLAAATSSHGRAIAACPGVALHPPSSA